MKSYINAKRNTKRNFLWDLASQIRPCPEDIKRKFGREFFHQFIESEAKNEFLQTILETDVKAAVTFNKGIFNLVSMDPIERYIERLMAGELIKSQIKGIDRTVPIFLTFPTGWRYRKQYMKFRKASIDTIRAAIGARD